MQSGVLFSFAFLMVMLTRCWLLSRCCRNRQSVTLGSLTKENPTGKLATAWGAFVGGKSNVTVVDAARWFEQLLLAKDKSGEVG